MSRHPRWLRHHSFVALLVVLFLCSYPALAQAPTERSCWEERLATSANPRALKILFIGHSKLFVNNMPKMFVYMTQQKAGGQPLKVYSVMGDAYSLEDHWNKGLARKVIAGEGPWDYVVLFEKSGRPEGRPEAFDRSLKLFNSEIAKAGAKLVLVENYDRPAAYANIHTVMSRFAARYRSYLLPFGTAWFISQKKDPSIDLLLADKHHPSKKGTYLMSCVCYAYFLGRNPVELPRFLYHVQEDDGTEGSETNPGNVTKTGKRMSENSGEGKSAAGERTVNIFKNEAEAKALQESAWQAVRGTPNR